MTETDRANRPEPGATGPAQPAHAAPELAPVIRSKIQPPALRSTTLSRQRLLDRLSDSASCRVTQVVAEAGYGKTTLLADFAAHSDLRTLWYRLDPTDADPITWANYLVAAAREHAPDFGRATSALLAQVSTAGPPNSVIVASVIDELHELGDVPSMLVLDDFHAVDGSAEARAFVEQLARDAPKWLRLVISSRRKPPLQFARLEALGELATVETDDLRFSLPETEQLFADVYGAALEPEVLRDVDRRARGWAASLQLFHGSIRGKSSAAVRALARALSGAASPVYDFLAEEVMSNVPDEIDELAVRASILDRVTVGYVVALFSDGSHSLAMGTAREWMDEADRLGLLSRTSQTSEARHLHPLLRDFLDRRLRQRMDEERIKQLHLQVARAVEGSEPLVATHHYLEAGYEREAMAALGSSVMLTMGSGQWGVASGLIDRLKGVPADPAVAAILARKLIEEGDLSGAAQLLQAIEVSGSPPDVRAVFRHAKLSLGWRTGDRDLMFATLEEIQTDTETPRILGDIAQVFIDASPLARKPVPLTVLARRMEQMSDRQRLAGHTYYAAISLHNAAIAALAAGRAREAVRLCELALDTYELLAVPVSERYSTHAVLAASWFELGDSGQARQHIAIGLSPGSEHGDVHAEFAYLHALIGDHGRAEQLLGSADSLLREGLSDLQGVTTATIARAFLLLGRDAEAALRVLAQLPRERPLDFGDTLAHQALECIAHLLAGRPEEAIYLADSALDRSRTHSARAAEVRIAVVSAIAREDGQALMAAVEEAASVGNLALLETADVLGAHLYLLPATPEALRDSMRRWPRRWLPVLRRQLERGAGPAGRAASILLDEVGEFEDVARLRAYSKTYSKRTRLMPGLGLGLASRVGPRLEIRDLGRVRLQIDDREIALSGSRRKPASLLMFLVTRPNLTATRDQVLEQLWPDADPISASNNLNQTLFFLRRDIDPWFEDDLSVNYVRFEGDLVWLDSEMVRVDSLRFLQAVREVGDRPVGAVEAQEVLARYSGQFAPEFEYDEWAIGWRARLHAVFLDFANATTDHLHATQHLLAARDIARRTLEIDPEAREIESRLVRLYWELGAQSAAVTQYEHLAAEDRSDGIDPPSFREATGRAPDSR